MARQLFAVARALLVVCLAALSCGETTLPQPPITPTLRLLSVATPVLTETTAQSIEPTTAPARATPPAPATASALPPPRLGGDSRDPGKSTSPPILATPEPAPPAFRSLNIEPAFPRLEFRGLTNLVQPPGGDDRLFVTEQPGRVLAFANDPEVSKVDVVLDLRDQVNDSGSEEGLLGLAFDPGFSDNGYLYVYYSASNPRRSVVSRFTMDRDQAQAGYGGAAEPQSELVLLEVEQPYRNHNGGQLAFGPDGYLYISLGDGGSGGDPQGNGQNVKTLLGSILRIDVSNASRAEPYRVPEDNPFWDDETARGEIWAYGLRNPWRFSFDEVTGDLWTGDVGQNRFEEIDLVVRGGNYGWNVLEGTHCFSPKAGCDPAGTALPVLEYPINGGCSVIGGYIYRAAAIPSLAGAYVYGDHCSGKVSALRYEEQAVTGNREIADTGHRITSFGVDWAGNLYVLTQRSGVFRLAP